MKLLTRHLRTNKNGADILKLLGDVAYLGKLETQEDRFSFKYARRDHRGWKWLTPIRGKMMETENGAEVTLEVHADVGVYIGWVIMACGLVKFFVEALFLDGNLWDGLMTLGFGALVAAFFTLRGFEILDILESRLRGNHNENADSI